MMLQILETRPQFLILSVLLVLHAAALAAARGHAVDWFLVVLAMAGLVLLHASVNVLNDWHDYARTGIDLKVRRTPFSGGSGLLPAGRISAGGALRLGLGTLAAGCLVGLYLAWVAGPPLLVIGLVGALSVVSYTPWLTRIGFGEVFAGLSLGVLPVVGTYFLLTGRLDTAAWVSGIPAGCLTYNLLLLNEFPDTEADIAGARRHMVVLLGKRKAARLYTVVELAAYVSLLAGVGFGALDPWALLGLGGALFACKAIAVALREYDSFEGIIPGMGVNVASVLGTNALMAAGYGIAALAR